MYQSSLRLPIFTPILLGVAGLFLATPGGLHAQGAVTENIVVSGEEVGSAYGAPPGFSRARFSPLTSAYVLPPDAFYASVIYEGDAFREGAPDHMLTEEIEIGLPHRFGAALEISQEHFRGETDNRSMSIELRYALADWNKIPLNPTLFAEYKFGTGRILHEERAPEDEMAPEKVRLNGENGSGEIVMADGGKPKFPDAYELRLLLSQDFGERVEWAMNLFFEQEVGGDRGREWGFAQSAVTPILLPSERLKAGVEMQYKNFTDKDTRNDPDHSFVIGPTLAWKPTRNTRIDLSPLFGVTEPSPRVQFFAVFSLLFGGGGSETGEAPASTRNR